MPNETGGPWVMGEPTTNRAEHKCVDGATKYFRADKCVACLTARLAAAEAERDVARRCARHFHKDAVSHGMLGSDAAWETVCPWLMEDEAAKGGLDE